MVVAFAAGAPGVASIVIKAENDVTCGGYAAVGAGALALLGLSLGFFFPRTCGTRGRDAAMPAAVSALASINLEQGVH